MTKELVEVLSTEYTNYHLNYQLNQSFKERIDKFWLNVEKMANGDKINKEELLNDNFMSELLDDYYKENHLHAFANDFQATKYFSELIKVYMNIEPTALAIALLKLDLRVSEIETRISYGF